MFLLEMGENSGSGENIFGFEPLAVRCGAEGGMVSERLSFCRESPRSNAGGKMAGEVELQRTTK